VLVLVVLGLAAAALGWRHVNGGEQGSMTARVLLSGSACRGHEADCAMLAHGGTIVVFGPIVEGTAQFPKHLVRLNAADSRVRLRLHPGDYFFAFFIQPPWATLLPNFGDGDFHVHAGRTTDLGVVRPSAKLDRCWRLVELHDRRRSVLR
jgi:hypothetical protein